MNQLRQFLANTVDFQAEFLIARLQNALPKMLAEAAPSDRANVQQQFERMASTQEGCFALADYVNFKGEGVLHTERYQGQGWGLLGRALNLCTASNPRQQSMNFPVRQKRF